MSDFLDAVRSAMKLADGLTIVASVLTVAGINFVFGEVPAIATVVLCVVFYVTGFLVACHRKMEQPHGGKSCPSQASLITLEDVRAAEDRARVQADAELASMASERDALRSERDELVAKVERLEKIVEAGERAVGSAYYADMMADYEESGIDEVGASPVDAGEVKCAKSDGEQLV